MKDFSYYLQVYFLLPILLKFGYSSIVPPPWADPQTNPCAALPGGWQLLYWSPLNKCFRIFTKGYPCPETMELSPVGNNVKNKMYVSECKCPPGTAQSKITSKCYNLFEQGPCDIGQYFAPIADSSSVQTITDKNFGTCKKPESCDNGMLFWAQDGKCYMRHSRGPCPKGKLLTLTENKITICMCSENGELAQNYYHKDGTCHEHFTRGPCEYGELFLPNQKCGCHVKLPYYDSNTDKCYEIGTIGPCPMGHIFTINENSLEVNAKGSCQCKEDYILWMDGLCYRKYTRGPCNEHEFLVNSTTCLLNPCGKGRLYFPEEKTCYRIGTQGPCNIEQVVVFDFTTRPSVDGISYNGVCGCMGIIQNLDQKCGEENQSESACASSHMIEINGNCYKLYSRGPCGPGQWLEPKKILNRNDRRGVDCQCRPGFTKYQINDNMSGCYAPSVGLARYLNARNNRSYKFSFQRYSSVNENGFNNSTS